MISHASPERASRSARRLVVSLILTIAMSGYASAASTKSIIDQLFDPKSPPPSSNNGNSGNTGGQGSAGPTVNTLDGPVVGVVKNGISKFLAIPYAAPPIGDLRWRPPAPPKKHALLDATEYGNTCPQVTTSGPFAGPTSTTEDCLFLNVFTTSTKGPLKPVLVWNHGGGDVSGASNDYDASKLATGGPTGTPTVVVTINYRLGLLGFLSHPALNSEGHPSGNYGIMDIQAALRWVKLNIAAFGGDPNRVTLAGQSGGASNVGANLISPYSAGLFHRAIMQSRPTSQLVSAAAALTRGNAFAAAADCSDAKCLRNLSVERILQLQGTTRDNGPFIIGSTPMIDATIVPIQPEVAWTTGKFNHMPIMGGTVKDEGNFLLSINEYFSGPPQAALTPQQYQTNNSAAVLQQYPLSAYGNNSMLAQNRGDSDRLKCQALHVLKAQAKTNTAPIYAYDFTYQNAPYYFPQMPNAQDSTGHFLPLAVHTADIQFLFLGYHGGHLGVNLDQITGQPRELNAIEGRLSDQLVAAWTNFASTGNPNAPKSSVWPVFTTSSPVFLRQDVPLGTETEAEYRANYKCDFWDLSLTYPTT